MSEKYTGKIWKLGDDIDTDIIIPTEYLALPSVDDMKQYAFYPLRPELGKQIQPGDIIVAGKNFGCGSSREHAPVVLKVKGVKVIIAHSFARIFYRNAINIGLPVMEIGDDVNQIEAGDTLDVDMAQGIIKITNKNITIKTNPLPAFIQSISDHGGLIETIKANALK